MKRQYRERPEDWTHEDEQWLDNMDQLSEEELMVLLSGDDCFPSRGAAETDSQTIAAIKSRTFERLGLVVEGTPGSSRDSDARREAAGRKGALRWAAIAVIAGLAVLGALIVGSPAVRAQIEKMLQYIPGYANVQEGTDDAPRYVLPTPVEAKGENGRMVQLRAVSIDRKQATIDLAGEGAAFPEQIELENTAGERIELKSSMGQRGLGTAGWKWTALYWYRGEIAVPKDGKFYLRYEGLTEPIAVQLQPAKSIRNMEELGTTVVKNGVALTAVVAEEGNESQRVTLLAQMPGNIKIQSYGIHPDPSIARTFLYTPSGERTEVVQDPAFPNPNEFILKRDPSETGLYRLAVDGIVAVKKADKAATATLPVPKEGKLDVNIPLTIVGYPVDLLSVERIKQPDKTFDSMLITLDAHYRADRPDNLLGFFPDADRHGRGGGLSSNGDPATGQIKQLWVEIDRKSSTYAMKVTEARILINGPWEFAF
ncbi:MAG: hypothetical protein J7639_22110 [Paenibacillaceae bacterium]|nr:hypothetical protein [Paenibacillaceae bacterium]